MFRSVHILCQVIVGGARQGYVRLSAAARENHGDEDDDV